MTVTPRYARGRHVRGPWAPPTFGNALWLVVLSALLPGSAQIASGRRRTLGRVALGLWAVLLVSLLGFGAYVLVRGDVVGLAGLAVRPGVLQALRAAAAVVGLGWLALLLHAAYIAGFHRWEPVQRLVAGALTLALAVVGLTPVGAAARYAGIQRDLISDVFVDRADSHTITAERNRERPNGRVNLLLLGGDGGKNRVGVRTDSMLVASVDKRTGKAVLISLPRSLQEAPFPPESPLAERFPNGFDAEDGLLSSVYVFGAQHRELFPHARDAGAEAIMQVAGEITGLPIDRYALVNLQGFQRLVQAMGGVDILVQERVPIGGRMGPGGVVIEEPDGWIEPGYKHLDGYEALWYARGRFGSDDYSRMRRQRCVMNAILGQAKPWKVIRNYQEIAASAKALVSTNVPQDELPELVDIALDTRKHRIVNVTFTRDVIDTVDPDFDRMRRVVQRAIDKSLAGGDRPGAGGTGAAKPKRAKPAGTATAKPRDITDDLERTCGSR